MSYAPTNPVDVPPYQIQDLISAILDDTGSESGSAHARCAQALGSEIYVGCSNGELIRFALHADSPDKLEAYEVLSRQTVPNGKPVDEVVLVPCLSRAFVLSDRTLHFYTLPALDPVSLNIVKPIRHVSAFAVDDQDLHRPPAFSPAAVDPVNFCVIKRNSIALYTMRERLAYLKEIPLPSGATIARRIGSLLCTADHTNYNMVNLEMATSLPILPLSQASETEETTPVKPSITVVGENEFLVLTWTGTGTVGLFVTGDGDPVRGTLEWPDHPVAICLDYPYVTALLPNDTIEIHSIETQNIVQVINAPRQLPVPDQVGDLPRARLNLVSSLGGYFVPSTQRSDKMRRVSVKLLRSPEPVMPP